MHPKKLVLFCVLLLCLSILTTAGVNLGSNKAAAATNTPIFTKGLVSVTFDDNYVSQYSTRQSLADNGIKATFYTVTSDVDNEPDFMTLDNLKQLKADGHEIASHSVTHPANFAGSNLTQELGNSKKWLEGWRNNSGTWQYDASLDLGPVYDFAYPNGDYNDAVEAATKQYYISGREGFAKYGGFETNNAANFNLTRIHVKRVLPTTTAADITTWVTNAKNNNEWLVLMYHWVEGMTPTPGPNDVDNYWYSIAPADFQAHMAAIHAAILLDSTKLASVTVKQALDEICPPTVTASVSGGNGSVTEATQNVNYGASATIHINPATGYHIASIDDGGAVSPPYANPYVINNVIANHNVVVTFAIDTFTVNASVSGGHGTVTEATQSVNYGGSATIHINPATGYHIASINDGGAVSAPYPNPYVINSVTANHNVVVTFIRNDCTIAATADPQDGGTISGAGGCSYGDPILLHASPNTGYHFINWTEGTLGVSTTADYSFAATGNRTLVAHFAINSYTITASADPGAEGTVSGGGTYTHGETVQMNASANQGYHFVNWTENGQEVSTDPNYSFAATGNRTLVAHFAIGISPFGTSTFYFAEGYTGEGFQEYLCLLNPNDAATTAHIKFMFKDGTTQENDVAIGKTTRETINVNGLVGPNKDVSIQITSGAPIVAERPMYFNYQGKWSGGHDVIGFTP